MAPPVAVRPENIIKTCENLIRVNNHDEALDMLKSFIASKKFKYVTSQSAEAVGLVFARLCVDKLDARAAKDGIISFRKNIQGIANGIEALGAVVEKLVRLAEEKLNNLVVEAKDVVEDDLISPESVLLSLMAPPDQAVSAAEVQAPFIRFMFEAYKMSIDSIRNTSQLEVLYCTIVSHAYDFCEKHGRKFDFHKLNDSVRTHLSQASYNHSANSVDVGQPATLERFLQLRFKGLRIAMKLDLHQEASRLVEDVDYLLKTSRRPAKPGMMLSYYESLAKIFNVAGNTLFRSAAWLKFFNLYTQSANATLDSLKAYASIIAISAVSIGPPSKDGAKSLRLAELLHMSPAPSRESIVSAVSAAPFMRFVDPDIARLFQLLETDEILNPLEIAASTVPILEILHEKQRYRAFFNDLVSSVSTKILLSVASCYSTFSLDRLNSLAGFRGSSFEIPASAIENKLIALSKTGAVSPLTIDHALNLLSFDTAHDVTENGVGLVLSNLCVVLEKSAYNIDGKLAQKDEQLTAKAIEVANQQIAVEIAEIERRNLILQKRQQQEEEAEQQKQEEIKKQRELKIAAEKQAEKERNEQEAERRAKEKRDRDLEEIKMKEKMKVAEEINKAGIITIEIDQIKDMKIDDLKKMQVEKLNKDQLDTLEHSKLLFKKADHLERAFRKYELRLLAEDEPKQQQKHIDAYNAMKEAKIKAARDKYEHDLKLHERLSKIVPTYKEFKSKIDAVNNEKLEELRKEAKAKLEKEKADRILYLKKQKLQKLMEEQRIEEERKRIEELRKAEEEKRAAEEAKKQKELEKLKEEIAEQRRKDEAILAKQRAAEEEAERRMSEKKTYQLPSKRSGIPSYRNASYGGDRTTPPEQAPSRSFSTSTASSKGIDTGSLTFAQRMKLKREGKLP